MNKVTKIGNRSLELVLGDITGQPVDVIVNAANQRLAGGGGVDGAIHRRGGPALMQELREKYPQGCPAGSAVVTGPGDLPARFVFHAVGPVWHGGHSGEAETLGRVYRTCLDMAEERRCESIVFPSISTGAYRYPIGQAAEIALGTMVADLQEEALHGERRSLQLIRFCLFSREDFAVYERCLEGLLRERRA